MALTQLATEGESLAEPSLRSPSPFTWRIDPNDELMSLENRRSCTGF
jgi:hypothetical protein